MKLCLTWGLTVVLAWGPAADAGQPLGDGAVVFAEETPSLPPDTSGGTGGVPRRSKPRKSDWDGYVVSADADTALLTATLSPCHRGCRRNCARDAQTWTLPVEGRAAKRLKKVSPGRCVILTCRLDDEGRPVAITRIVAGPTAEDRAQEIGFFIFGVMLVVETARVIVRDLR